jgi:hypothetical protein
MRTAKETAADLYAVPDDLAMTMLTHGCDRLNGAFQAVECMFRAGSYDIETLVVIVTANFARSHWNSSIPFLMPHPQFCGMRRTDRLQEDF